MAIKNVKRTTKNPHYTVDKPASKVNKEDLEPCVVFVTDAWESWSDHWSSRFDDFEKYYDRWIGKAPKRDEEWQSQFHKKLTWQAVATLVARVHGALFPNSAPIDVTRTETTDDLAAILAKSIVAHWFKIGEVIKVFLAGMRSSAVYGTGLFEDDWYVKTEKKYKKEESRIPDYRPMVDDQGQPMLDGQGRARNQQVGMVPTYKTNAKTQVVEDRYRVRKANIFSWRVHPNKISDDDDYPSIKQEFITYDDLLERQTQLEKYGITGFENMDEIKEDTFKIEEKDAQRYSKEGDFEDDDNPRLELLTYWGMYAEEKGDAEYDKNTSKKRPMCVMVVNRKWKLKLADNPRWDKKSPLFHIVWTEDEKPCYYGIGLSQIGADAEDRANNVVNIRTDVKKKSVRGSGWYNANDKKIKKSDLVSNVPGKMRACTDVDKAVKYDLIPGPDVTDYKEEEIAVNDHREITGATTSLLPTADTSQQHKTLGGLEILVGQGLSRLKPDLQMMEIMGVRAIANRAFIMTRQYFTQPQMIELMAPEDKLRQMNVDKMYKLTPREITEDIHFFCTGLSESMDKAQNVEKLLKFVEISGKIPQMAAIVNYAEIGKQIATWLGLEDADKLIMGYGQPGQPAQPPQGQDKQQQDRVSQSISFKDLPPDGKVQLAAKAGIRLDPNVVASQALVDHHLATQPQGAPQGPQGQMNGNGQAPQMQGPLPAMLQNLPPHVAMQILARMNGQPQ